MYAWRRNLGSGPFGIRDRGGQWAHRWRCLLGPSTPGPTVGAFLGQGDAGQLGRGRWRAEDARRATPPARSRPSLGAQSPAPAPWSAGGTAALPHLASASNKGLGETRAGCAPPLAPAPTPTSWKEPVAGWLRGRPTCRRRDPPRLRVVIGPLLPSLEVLGVRVFCFALAPFTL